MKRRSLPVGILALALMVALGSLGVAYGAYTQNLTAVATVNTATVNVHFANEIVAKTNPTGAQTCTLSGQGTSELSLAIGNALPFEGCAIVTDVVNDSSIPITLSAPSFDNGGATWLSGQNTYGLAPYIIAAGNSLPAHALVVYPDGSLDVSTAQSATGTFTFVASE